MLDGINVVDPLADERALTEQVLVSIRDGACVGVDARLATKQACIARAIRPRQADRHPRLQDAVAGYDPPLCVVVARMVQRMRHGTDKLPSRITRQLRIRIQCNHVLHGGKNGRVSDDERKAIRSATPAAASQQRVQIRELAALALVAHPTPFFGVPAPRTMEEKKQVVAGLVTVRRVFLVQRGYSHPGQLQQRPVLGKRFLVCVRKIGQQAEVQVFVPIGQKLDFQLLD